MLASLVPETDWSYEQEFKDFQRVVEKEIANLRKEQLEKLMKEMKVNIVFISLITYRTFLSIQW